MNKIINVIIFSTLLCAVFLAWLVFTQPRRVDVHDLIHRWEQRLLILSDDKAMMQRICIKELKGELYGLDRY